MEKKSPRLKALLTPGEVAKRSGVAVSALHFYESKGLITSIRNSGNQRRYKRDVLRYVAIIKIAQRIGNPAGNYRRRVWYLAGRTYVKRERVEAALLAVARRVRPTYSYAGGVAR